MAKTKPPAAPRKGTHTADGFIPTDVDRIDIADAKADAAQARCLELEHRVAFAHTRCNALESRVTTLQYPPPKPRKRTWLNSLSDAAYETVIGLAVLAVILLISAGPILAAVACFRAGYPVLGSIPVGGLVLYGAYLIGKNS